MLLLLATVACILCLQTAYTADQGKKLFLVEAVEKRKFEIIRWLISEEANVNIQDAEGKTPLMHASVMMNDTDILQELIASGADTDITQHDGKTALHLAAEVGAIDAVQLLFPKTKNTNVTDVKGRSVLHAAVMSDKEGNGILLYLLEQGLDIYIKDTNGFTVTHVAALLGKTSALTILLDLGIDIDLVTSNDTTPLILASLSGHYETAEYLIKSGANINAKDNMEWSSLHAAAYTGHFQLVKLLVENNSTLDIINSDGRTPLYLAVEQGHFDITEYLTSKGCDITMYDNFDNTMMHAAATSGKTQLINFFIERNIEINDFNQNGSTPLIIAIEKGHEDTVNFLIKNEADISIVKKLGLSFVKQIISTNNTNSLTCVIDIDENLIYNSSDSSGVTLLHHASKYSNELMVTNLLELMVSRYVMMRSATSTISKPGKKSGACFPCYMSVANVKDLGGRTPLHYAAQFGNAEALDVLLNQGAFINIADNKGLTSLHVAAFSGHTAILETLAQYNPNMNAVDDNGKTALFLSAEAGHLDSMKYLIDIGADTTIKDSRGWSLLHVAAAKGLSEIIQELLKIEQLTSSDINSVDKEGKTPAWYAINNGFLEILSQLELNGAQINENDVCNALENDKFKLGSYESFKKRIYSNGFNAGHLSEVYVPKELTHIVKLFTTYRCYINRPDEEGKTALWYAVDGQRWDIVAELENKGGLLRPNVTLIQAARRNQIGFVKYHLKNGASAQTEDDGRWPIVFIAALHGNTEIVKLLLDAGAGVDSKIPGWEWTPLQAAAWVGYCDTVKLLLSRRANLHIINSFRQSAREQSKPSCREMLH